MIHYKSHINLSSVNDEAFDLKVKVNKQHMLTAENVEKCESSEAVFFT